MKNYVNKAKVDLLSSRGDLLKNLSIVLKSDSNFDFYFNLLTKNKNYSWLFRNLVPDKYELLPHNIIPVSKNYHHTMLWYSLFFDHFHNELSLFIERKALFEGYYLNGDYEKARTELEYIENNVCFSIWGLIVLHCQ